MVGFVSVFRSLLLHPAPSPTPYDPTTMVHSTWLAPLWSSADAKGRVRPLSSPNRFVFSLELLKMFSAEILSWNTHSDLKQSVALLGPTATLQPRPHSVSSSNPQAQGGWQGPLTKGRMRGLQPKTQGQAQPSGKAALPSYPGWVARVLRFTLGITQKWSVKYQEMPLFHKNIRGYFYTCFLIIKVLNVIT